MEVTRAGSARGADKSDPLTSANGLARPQGRLMKHVHVDVVELRGGAAHHDIVAGPGSLVAHQSHPSSLRRDYGPGAFGKEILPLVAPPRP